MNPKYGKSAHANEPFNQLKIYDYPNKKINGFPFYKILMHRCRMINRLFYVYFFSIFFIHIIILYNS